jgi:hypothetical protein
LFLGAGLSEVAIRTREFYYVESSGAPGEPTSLDRTRQLFAKPSDRFDILNVADQFPDTAASLEKELHTFLNSQREIPKWRTALDK